MRQQAKKRPGFPFINKMLEIALVFRFNSALIYVVL
jgi:hypothetical protein